MENNFRNLYHTINIDDLINYMERVAINSYGERFAPIIKALMPILKKNLEINKGKYERQEIGNGSTTIRFDRAKEPQKSTERGVGKISGDIEGATADTVYDSETQAFEVAPRYSIPAPDPSEAFYDDMPIGRNIQKVLLKSFEQHLYFISRSLALLWLLEVVVDTAEEDKRVFVSSLW